MLGGLSTLQKQINSLSLDPATQAACSIADLPVRRPGELSGALKWKPVVDASSTESYTKMQPASAQLDALRQIFPPLVGAAADNRQYASAATNGSRACSGGPSSVVVRY